MTIKKAMQFFTGVAITIVGVEILDAVGIGGMIRNFVRGIFPGQRV